MPESHRHGPRAARGRLLRLAVLPGVLLIFLAAAAVILVPRTPATAVSGSGLPWVVPVAGMLTCAVLAAAAAAALAEARAQNARLHAGLAALRQEVAGHRAELQTLRRRAERGERFTPPDAPPSAAPGQGDCFGELSREIAAARYAAEKALAAAAETARGAGDRNQTQVFTSLARRIQSFVRSQAEHLDELENETEDPELLRGLFHLEHLATRVRRQAENLAVLGGSVSRPQWTKPVHLSEVLRSSVAEVEHYARIRLVPPVEGALRGHVVADVVHMLAELIENATAFSAPRTQVLLRARPVAEGLEVEVEDRGLGMTEVEQRRMNAVLSGAARPDTAGPAADGRAGLCVVSALARRHRIVVQLRSNLYGGVQAVLMLPHELLGKTAETRFAPASGRGAARPLLPHFCDDLAVGAAPPVLARLAPGAEATGPAADTVRNPDLNPDLMAVSRHGADLAEASDDR